MPDNAVRCACWVAQAERDMQDEARLQTFEAFRDKYHGIEHTGVVRWFDALSGEGMVSLEDGTSLYLHFTSIEGVDKNRYTWPTDADRKRLETLNYNTPCKVIPYISYGGVMCERVTIIGWKE